jgi:hypothetical protein
VGYSAIPESQEAARHGCGSRWRGSSSPIDLIPEFIPVAGPLDDAIVAAFVLRYLLRRTNRAVLFEHWRGDVSTLDAILGSQRQESAQLGASAERNHDETPGGSIWRSRKGGSHIG